MNASLTNTFEILIRLWDTEVDNSKFVYNIR